jgi:hypothetical protein
MSRSFRYRPLPPPVFDDKKGYDFTPLVVWVEMCSDAHRWSGSIAALLSHNFLTTNQWEISRILNWRYVSTIFWAIFCGDIPLHRPEK